MPSWITLLATVASTLANLSVEAHVIGPCNATTPPDITPTAFVKNGTIFGTHSSTYNQDFFLGIPFAQPPVGHLRFRIPQSLNSSFTRHYEAFNYAPECVGYGGDQIGYPISEDCLYLNVIRPAGYDNQSLPVGVWIHGGGLVEGGTRDKRYNLTFIVDNSVRIGKPFIAVSIAYRLSAWGFLSSQELSATGNTNFGLRDQRLALHWIRENIGAFGGDPDKVTIWGESAGAGSVGWHLTAYNGRDDKLFRAGIMESGNPINYGSYRENAAYQPLYNGIVRHAACANSTDTLACLREVPFATLNRIINTTEYVSGWAPIVDGDFIQRWGSIQLAEGDFVKVPIIDGANTDEGTAFSPLPVRSEQDLVRYMTDTATRGNVPQHFADQVIQIYSGHGEYEIPESSTTDNFNYTLLAGAQFQRSAAYYGDVVMIANRRGTCQTWAANNLPAYCYRFNTRPAGVPAFVGVTHFTEVPFVFDNTRGLGYNAAHRSTDPFLGKPQSYFELAYLMSSSWASFIHDLDPNGFATRFNEAPEWPSYSNSNPQNIVWDAKVTSLAFIEADTWRQAGIQWILDHAFTYRR